MKKALMLSLVLVIGQLVLAGSLEPSAGPGSTMKTLDEVEPRIPISQSDIPKTINTPGSYYLTEEISATGIAITINVDDVTIDLMDFTMKGPGSGTSYGVYMNGRSNVEIHSGTVRDFRYGIIEINPAGRGHRVIDVRALSNGYRGIYLEGNGHLVKDCMVSDNGTSSSADVYGISAGIGSMVTGNTVRNNGTSASGIAVYSIQIGSASTVTGNTVRNNGTSSTVTGYVYGISSGISSIVTANIVHNNGTSATGFGVLSILTGYGNTVTGNTVCDNGISAAGVAPGITVGFASTITDNTIYNNLGKGISAGSACTITGNTIRDSDSEGIKANDDSMVTGNTVISCQGIGIKVGSSSMVTGNIVQGSGSHGIQTDYGCTITGNTVTANQSNGIQTGSLLGNGNGCTVTGNSVRYNNIVNNSEYAGIRVNGDSMVKGNTLYNNFKNNIFVMYVGNAIEENLIIDCLPGNGIYFDGGGNFYANNRAAGNTTNYAGTVPAGTGDGGGNASF